MNDFFDNIETQEQIISEDTQQEKFCVFSIETCSYEGRPNKDIVDLYNCEYLKKLVKRNLDAINLSDETKIRYKIEAIETSQPDSHNIIEPVYTMPYVSVKVYGNFGNTKDVIDFISALAFMRTLPTRKMYHQIVYYGALSYIKFNNATMFITESCNTNQYLQGFGENFNNLVYIVDTILRCSGTSGDTKIGEVIRYLGQWPFGEKGVRAIVKEHAALLDNYNIQLQNDYTDVVLTVPYEEQEKAKREYEYPTFLRTISKNRQLNDFSFCESNWKFVSRSFNLNLNYENLYKLLKRPPQSVMITLAVSDTVELINCCKQNMLSQTISLGWHRLWKKGVVVLNGFNNSKCKFSKQNLVDTLFDEDWYKLPDEFAELINLDVLKTLKTPKRMTNIIELYHSSDDMTGCAVVYLGQLLICGELKEITLGLYGTRGRIAQQLRKLFSNIKISKQYAFCVEEKKD